MVLPGIIVHGSFGPVQVGDGEGAEGVPQPQADGLLLPAAGGVPDGDGLPLPGGEQRAPAHHPPVSCPCQ